VNVTVLADAAIPGLEEMLGPAVAVRRFTGRALDAAQLRGVDALLVRSVTPVDAALLRRGRVRFVGTATAGVDHVDRDYLARAGIAFAHAPGANANSVVEYVLAAIAAVGEHLERLLAGGRVGIVGYGHVGRALADRLRALGIQCLAYDPWLPADTFDTPASLQQVLGCEVVSLHAELTRAQPWPSYHLLGAGTLQWLRPDALLINTCRGAVVDNRALRGHLLGGRGPEVVLDVWEGEPDIDPGLLELAVLGSAHIAGYSWDGKLRATRALCAALGECLSLPPPSPAAPAQAPAIAVAPALSGSGLLRALLRAHYDIRHDDAQLREVVLGTPPRSARAGFDRLRRDYPRRRELAGSQVTGASDPDLVTALGAVTVATGVRR